MGYQSGEIRIQRNKHYKFGIVRPGQDRHQPEPSFQKNPAPMSISGYALLNDYGIKTFDEFLSSPHCPYPANKIVAIYANNTDSSLGSIYLGEGNPRKLANAKGGLADENVADGMKAMVSARDPEYDAASKSIAQAVDVYKEQIAGLMAQNNALREEHNNYVRKAIETETELNKKINDLTAENIKLGYQKAALEELHEKIKTEGLNDGPSMAETIISSGVQLMSTPGISDVIAAALGAIANKFGVQTPPPAQLPAAEAHAPTPSAPTAPTPMRIDY